MNGWEGIFDIKTTSDFEQWSLKVFDFQSRHNAVYKEFCEYLGRTNPKSIEEIPFLPISFFKSQQIKTDGLDIQTIFKSSGTTKSIRSQHLVQNTSIYNMSFKRHFEKCFGKISDCVILAVLPNYLEQGASSLVYMVDELIRNTKNKLSGFYLENHEELAANIELAEKHPKSK